MPSGSAASPIFCRAKCQIILYEPVPLWYVIGTADSLFRKGWQTVTAAEIVEESRKRGLLKLGTPVRRTDLEPNHLYVCYMDEYDNEFVVRRGILTVVTADGKVY